MTVSTARRASNTLSPVKIGTAWPGIQTLPVSRGRGVGGMETPIAEQDITTPL